MTPLNIVLESDDYIAANALHCRGQYVRLFIGMVVGYLVVVLGMSAVLDRSLPEPVGFGIGLAAIVALGGVWLLCARFVLLPTRSRRIFRQQKNLHQPFQITWDDETMATTATSGHNTTPWQDFLKWRENTKLFLLYRSDVMFNLIPKRAFSDSEGVEDFRRLAKEKICATQGRRRKEV